MIPSDDPVLAAFSAPDAFGPEPHLWATEWKFGLKCARWQHAQDQAEIDALRTDLESGFMKGAYARLKELQNAETALSVARAKIEALRDALRNSVALWAQSEKELSAAREEIERLKDCIEPLYALADLLPAKAVQILIKALPLLTPPEQGTCDKPADTHGSEITEFNNLNAASNRRADGSYRTPPEPPADKEGCSKCGSSLSAHYREDHSLRGDHGYIKPPADKGEKK